MPEKLPECYQCARRVPRKSCPTCGLPLCEDCTERHKRDLEARNQRASLKWIPTVPAWYHEWAEEEMRKIREWQESLFLVSATNHVLKI